MAFLTSLPRRRREGGDDKAPPPPPSSASSSRPPSAVESAAGPSSSSSPRPFSARSSSPSSSGTASPPAHASPRSVLGGEAADRALAAAAAKAADAPSTTTPLVHIHVHNDSAAVTQAPDGVRLAPGDLALPRPNTAAEHALAVCTMLLFFGLAQGLPLLFAACAVAALVWRSAVAVLVLATGLFFTLLPPGCRTAAVLHSPIWDAWRRYFRYCGVVPTPPYCEPGKPHVFAHFPHAVYPMGSFLSFPLCGDPATGVPAPMEGLVASVLLRVPLFKHIFAGLGCHPADKATMMRHLRTSSVGVIVEGIAGVFQGATPEAERVYLSRRKGFVKAAIQAGAPLVPVYHLGASQVLSFAGHGSLSRKWRLTVAAYWGAGGLPLPRRHPIISVVGKPIAVQQDDSPDQATIDAVHARFVDALVALFDGHKHLLGPEWAAKTLEVV